MVLGIMSDHSGLSAKSFKRAEYNVQRKLKLTFLKGYPHHIVPGYNLARTLSVNLSNDINISDLYRELPYNYDLPKPLLPPARSPRIVLNEEDPALQLISVKSHINDYIRRITEYYQKYHKEFGAIHKKDIKWIKSNSFIYTELPKYVAEVADALESDPDSHFTGAYNWYYTGGCVGNMYLNGLDILVFPYMGELITSQLLHRNGSWKPVFQNATKCHLDNTLYELRHNISNGTCRMLGRHKNYCSLYSLSESENQLSLHEVHRQSAEFPYVSADVNLSNINQYCTLDIKKTITLWDITKMNHITRNTLENTTLQGDPWGCIRLQPLDPNIIFLIDRCCLHYMDARITFKRPCLTLCPKVEMEECDGISVAASSRNHFCKYIGSYHNLFMCDNRRPNQCVQQKWTHQFRSAPLLMCVTNRNEEEIIILSSQLVGENTIVLNNWLNTDDVHSYHLPFTPPNIMDTLYESQMQGLCLDPSMKTRFELCNVGSAVITDENGNITLFIQNSIGDIFYQCITHKNLLDKYSDINSRGFYMLNNWEQALVKQDKTIMPLAISEKATMEHVFTNLKSDKLFLKDNEQSEIDYDPSWKQPLQKLNSYTDILAPELLAVWEICENVPVSTSGVPHQKVLSWLETASRGNDLSQTQEDRDFIVPSAISTQELLSVSQEPDIENIIDSNALQDLLLPKVKTGNNKKKKAT